MSTALVSSVVGFMICRALLGGRRIGQLPRCHRTTTEWFPSEERALATGLFNSGSNASAFIAPILIAAVTLRWGWHAAFICTGSMGLLWLLCFGWPFRTSALAGHNAGCEGCEGASGCGCPRSRTSTSASGSDLTLSPSAIFSHRGLYAFGLRPRRSPTPIWWFYLFYLPTVPQRELRTLASTTPNIPSIVIPVQCLQRSAPSPAAGSPASA